MFERIINLNSLAHAGVKVWKKFSVCVLSFPVFFFSGCSVLFLLLSTGNLLQSRKVEWLAYVVNCKCWWWKVFKDSSRHCECSRRRRFAVDGKCSHSLSLQPWQQATTTITRLTFPLFISSLVQSGSKLLLFTQSRKCDHIYSVGEHEIHLFELHKFSLLSNASSLAREREPAPERADKVIKS